MSDWIEVTDHDDESRKHQLKRHPIFISEHTIVLLTMFRAGNHFSDLWLTDFSDHYSDLKRATKQLVEQIGDHASIAFWQELRAAIADEIDRQSKNRGHQFKHDRNGTHKTVPVEPTEEMLHACQAAMKNFIRSLTPEERLARGWNKESTRKNGYRIKPHEKAKLRYKAMIEAAP